MSIIIDEEFKNLIPPLSSDEFAQLEENCVKEGIRDALIVWETPNGTKVLIDGHNRFQIAARHGLHWNEKAMQFSSRDEAKLWIIENQLGRRNLPTFDRVTLEDQKKDILAEQAKEKIGGDKKSEEYKKSLARNLVNDKDAKSYRENKTDYKIAQSAGTSEDTVRKVRKINELATDHTKQLVREGKLSINQAFQGIKREEKKKEVQKRIEDYADVQTGIVDIRNAEKKI